MTADEKIAYLQMQVTALKGVTASIILVLAKRDISIAREIVDAIPETILETEKNAVAFD